MSRDPKTPVRADHRYIMRLCASTLGGKVEHVPSEFDRLGRVFRRVGGSWVRLFRGSPEDVVLLKRVLRVAFKRGFLTKKQDWGA